MRRPEEEETVIMTIDIGDGRQGDILITQKSDSRQLAQEFCEKYRLDSNACQALEQHIRESIFSQFKPPMNSSASSKKVNEKSEAYYRGLQDGLQLYLERKPKMKKKASKRRVSPVKRRDLSIPKIRHMKTNSVPEVLTKSPKKTINSARNSPRRDPDSQNKFRELFEMMNPIDGVITKQSVRKKDIPALLAKILRPLLTEIIELDIELNFKDFCNRMELLQHVITPYETSKLFGGNINKDIVRRKKKRIKR